MMETQIEFQPALQVVDLNILKDAAQHLLQLGYPSQIKPWEEVTPSELEEWMNPAQGGYLLSLPADNFFQAMNELGKIYKAT